MRFLLGFFIFALSLLLIAGATCFNDSKTSSFISAADLKIKIFKLWNASRNVNGYLRIYSSKIHLKDSNKKPLWKEDIQPLILENEQRKIEYEKGRISIAGTLRNTEEHWSLTIEPVSGRIRMYIYNHER